MGIPVAAAILDLGEDELQPALVVGRGRARDTRQEPCAKHAIREYLDEFAAIHRLDSQELKS